LPIEPDNDFLQGQLGGRADLKTLQDMGTLAIKAKYMMKAGVDGLDDLADAGQPGPPGPWPGMAAVTLRSCLESRRLRV
jgi:hypothetical protein